MDTPLGNMADLAAGQFLLPSFVQQRDALYIDLSAIDSRALFSQFVERVFSSNAYFCQLDYELFLNLLFRWESADIGNELERCEHSGREPVLRLAQRILPFPPERREIYRGVKLLDEGQAAEYFFEQVSVEVPAAQGEDAPPQSQRVFLDFDEFVAALWEKGVRFGIDAVAVRAAIARDSTERLTVAHLVAPVEGADASILEQTRQLHRDDAPKLRNDGRMDLCQYQNRFPQVNAGTRLFKKVPRVVGVSGWNVAGRELLSQEVKDFDIHLMSGPGTQVAKQADGEYVIALIDGFLDIDTDTGMLSVVTKIVNRQGVSLRTTGDLSLAGKEFEEHGEVQEKRVVNGHNMTFLNDVFGVVNSDGGRITLKRNISGGTAKSAGGVIHVEGNASRATLESLGGEVFAVQVEGCLIVAGKVKLQRAVLCDIVADEVTIDVAEGCMIAARVVRIGKSGARKDQATSIMLPLPNLERYAREQERLDNERREAEAEILTRNTIIEELTAQPDMKSYLSIQPRLKSGKLTMSSAQETQWRALLDRLRPALKSFADQNRQLQEARQRLADAGGFAEQLVQERKEAMQGLACSITEVMGETQVRTRCRTINAPVLESLPQKDLHKVLSGTMATDTMLFSAGSGSFSWQPPPEAESS